MSRRSALPASRSHLCNVFVLYSDSTVVGVRHAVLDARVQDLQEYSMGFNTIDRIVNISTTQNLLRITQCL